MEANLPKLRGIADEHARRLAYLMECYSQADTPDLIEMVLSAIGGCGRPEDVPLLESLFKGQDRQGALSKRKQARMAQALRSIATVAPDERRLPALPGLHLPQF